MSSPIRKILCVCTGNTCRSPLAEALLRHAIAAESASLASIEVISAGLAAFSGDSASHGSQTAARSVGIDLSKHCSRRVTQTLIEEVDLVLCMTRSHVAGVLQYFDVGQTPVMLFRELMGAGVDLEIGDPVAMPQNVYDACRDEMVEAIPSILDYLRRSAGQ